MIVTAWCAMDMWIVFG